MSKPQLSGWLVSFNCRQLQYAWRAPTQNVSTKRNGPRPEMRPIGPRLRWDRDVEDFVRDETSRPRPHPCEYVSDHTNFWFSYILIIR